MAQEDGSVEVNNEAVKEEVVLGTGTGVVEEVAEKLESAKVE